MGASVKIGCNSSDFQSKFKAINATLKETQSALSVVAAKATQMGKTSDTLKAKQDGLKAKITALNQTMQLYKDRMSNISANINDLKAKYQSLGTKIADINTKYKESVQETGKNSEQSKKLKQELENLKQKYEATGNAIKSNETKLQSFQTKLNNTNATLITTEGDLKKVNAQLASEKWDSLSSSMSKASEKFKSVGSTLTTKVTAPIIGLGTVCTNTALTFEDSMAKLSSLMDKSVVSTDDMKNAVMELSNQTGISASEIAEAGYTAISSGADTAKALDVVKSTAVLAKTGFTDLATALDLSTTVMNAYGMSADQLSHISDVLNVTQDKGKTTIGALGESMGNVIPTATMYNVSLEQLSAGYAALTKNGIETSQAGVSLNSVLSELGKSGTKASDVLKEKTGKSFADLMASGMNLNDVLAIVSNAAKESGLSIGDVFSNKNAIKGASSLTNNANDFVDSLNAINNTSGITDDKLSQLQTTNSGIKKALNELKNAAIQFGEIITPTVEKVAKKVKELGEKLNGLDENQRKNVVTIALVAAAIGPVLLIIGKLCGAISKVATLCSAVAAGMAGEGALAGVMSALAGPVGIAIAVIVALIGTLTYLYKTNENVRNALNGAWESIKGVLSSAWETIKPALSQLWESIKNLATQLKPFFIAMGAYFTVLLGVVIGVINGIIQALGPIISAISNVVDFIANILGALKALFTGDLDGAKNYAMAALGNLKDFVINILNALWQLIKGVFTGIWGTIKTVGSMIGVNISQVVSDIWNKIVAFFTSIPTKLGEFVNNVWTSICTFCSNMINKAIELGTGFVNGIISFFSNLPYNIGYIVGTVIANVSLFVENMINKATELGSNFVNNIVSFFSNLPTNIANIVTSAYNSVVNWGSNMINKAIEVGSNFINNVINFFAQLPSNIWNTLCNVVNSVISWGSNLISSGANAAQGLVNSIVNTVTSLPGKMLEIGRNIVQGIWNGITNAKDWLLEKVSSFASGVVDGIKDALGIHSPSRVMRDEVGKFMAEGIGVGFNDNMKDVSLSMNKTMNSTVGITQQGVNKATTKAHNENNGTFIVQNYLDSKIIGENCYNYTNKKLALAGKKVR